MQTVIFTIIMVGSLIAIITLIMMKIDKEFFREKSPYEQQTQEPSTLTFSQAIEVQEPSTLVFSPIPVEPLPSGYYYHTLNMYQVDQQQQYNARHIQEHNLSNTNVYLYNGESITVLEYIERCYDVRIQAMKSIFKEALGKQLFDYIMNERNDQLEWNQFE